MLDQLDDTDLEKLAYLVKPGNADDKYLSCTLNEILNVH